MTAFRRFLILGCALILAVTSQGLAVARGQGAVTGYMVICAAGGFVTVPVGADGAPAGHPHICPDGIQMVAGALVAAEDWGVARRIVAFDPAVMIAGPVAPAGMPPPVARGPPVPA